MGETISRTNLWENFIGQKTRMAHITVPFNMYCFQYRSCFSEHILTYLLNPEGILPSSIYTKYDNQNLAANEHATKASQAGKGVLFASQNKLTILPRKDSRLAREYQSAHRARASSAIQHIPGCRLRLA